MVTFYAYIRQTYLEKNEHQRILKILFPVNEKGHLSEKPEISTGYLEQLWRVTYIITQTKMGPNPILGPWDESQLVACSQHWFPGWRVSSIFVVGVIIHPYAPFPLPPSHPTPPPLHSHNRHLLPTI